MNVDPPFAGMLAHINEHEGSGRTFSGEPDDWRSRITAAIEGGRDLTAFDGVASSEDVTLGETGVRVYRPESRRSTATLVYFHPGGFAAGSVWLAEDVALRIVAETGACVVSVDHRLTPEHPFPAPLDDAVTATKWVFSNAAGLGGRPDQVAFVGESSGANLAAAATLDVYEDGLEPAALLLVTPYTNMSRAYPSQGTFGDGYFISNVDLQDIRRMYLGNDASDADPRVSPALSDRLSVFPPTIIAVAGHDPLRDDGIVFAARLLEAGVEVTLRPYPTLIHPFFGMPQVSPTADAAVVELCGDLIDVLQHQPTEE